MSIDTSLRIANLLKIAEKEPLPKKQSKSKEDLPIEEIQPYTVHITPNDAKPQSFCTSDMSPAEKLQCLYDRDKFINGALVAAKCQSYGCRKVIGIIYQLSDRTLSENTVRRVWDYWKQFNKVHFTTASKQCIYSKFEASIMCQNIPGKEPEPPSFSSTVTTKPIPAITAPMSPSPSQQLSQQHQQMEQQPDTVAPRATLLPFIRNVLLKNSRTDKLQVNYVSFEEVKGFNSFGTFKTVREIIKSNKRTEAPSWVNVSIKIMISVSQFQIKKNIEFQCFQKLKEVIYYKCIQWIGVVMGEPLSGRGKFIYLHCKYDKNVIKRKRHLKAFFLEQIPTYFYSRNSLTTHKVQIMGFEHFLKAYKSVMKVEYPTKFH